jgi:hypothetical protein
MVYQNFFLSDVQNMEAMSIVLAVGTKPWYNTGIANNAAAHWSNQQ